MHENPAKIAMKNPEVSKELEDIVLKCLKKDPDESFQTVDELLAALRALS